LGNGQSGAIGVQDFKEPGGIKTNILYLAGGWDIQKEYAESQAKGAKIIFRYQAQKVFMVARADQEVNLTILIDGEPISAVFAGSDLVDGQAKVKTDRLYRLVEDLAGHNEHTLEIISAAPGLQIFTFTFG